MSIVSYNNRSIKDITAIPGAAKSLTHIKTLTASSSSTLSFVNGSSDVVLDSTYPIYIFKYINMHPATDNAELTVGFRDGSTDYDATKTTTVFRAYHNEGGSDTTLAYVAGNDLAQSTGFQKTGSPCGNDADQCVSGYLQLFNPSSTTFVKHFLINQNLSDPSNYSINDFVAGYCNVTAAIDAVQFKFSSGNVDAGTIKLYGLKDS
jgi:hypothetical protein